MPTSTVTVPLTTRGSMRMTVALSRCALRVSTVALLADHDVLRLRSAILIRLSVFFRCRLRAQCGAPRTL